MQLTAEALIVSLVMILPGFVAILFNDRLAYRLRGQDNTQDRSLPTMAMKSITISIFINAAAIFIFVVIFGYGADMATTLENAKALTTDLRVRDFVWYLLSLYGLALLAGGLLGGPSDGFWRYLHDRGWTSIAPSPNVWSGATNQIYQTIAGPREDLPPDQQVLWLRIELDEGRHLYGILRRSTVRIDHDKSFEAFLSSPMELNPATGARKPGIAGLAYRGVYFRITPDTKIHMLTGPAGWEPPAPAEPVVEPFAYQGNAVYCRGVAGNAGHPGIYIAIEPGGTATCPYCNQNYAFADHA